MYYAILVLILMSGNDLEPMYDSLLDVNALELFFKKIQNMPGRQKGTLQ